MTNFAAVTRPTMLALRICAARLDANVSAEEFAQLVADFREAVEQQGAAPSTQADGTKCPFCHEIIAGPLVEHDCTRKREIGFGPALEQLRLHEKRSMGAAAAVPSAAKGNTEPDHRTASETPPAAPSTNTTSEPQQSPGAALSEVSRSYTADNDRSKAVAADETPRAPSSSLPPLDDLDSTRDASIAEPAPSQQPPPSTTAAAADGAGTSPAGVSAGAEASQPRTLTAREKIRAAYQRAKGNSLRAPNGIYAKLADEFDCSESWIKRILFEQADVRSEARKPGRQRTFTEAECRALRAEWLAAKAISYRSPWTRLKAKELGVSEQTIRNAIESVKHLQPLPAPKKAAAASTAAPAPALKREPVPDYVGGSRQEVASAEPKPNGAREHTHSHACWCRKSPCNTKNPWCSIAKPSKPVGNLAGLSEPPRRAERYRGAA